MRENLCHVLSKEPRNSGTPITTDRSRCVKNATNPDTSVVFAALTGCDQIGHRSPVVVEEPLLDPADKLVVMEDGLVLGLLSLNNQKRRKRKNLRGGRKKERSVTLSLKLEKRKSRKI